MAEYINRERARFEAKRYFKNMGEIQEDLDMLFCMLPPEDVAPVRHGRWTWTEDGEEDWEQFYRCSNCGEKEYWESNYCPSCGAKMDLPDECEQDVER